MMRYQRVSPDVLPPSNGRKPSNQLKACKDDDATYRVRSGPGSDSPAQTHPENHFLNFRPTSPPSRAEMFPLWGNRKRPRGARAENRTAWEESTSSRSVRSTVKIQRRAAIAGAEKIAAAAAAAAMPPPSYGGAIARAANRRLPLKDSSIANTNNHRTVDDRSSSQTRSDKTRSKPALNGFGPGSASMNQSDTKAPDPDTEQFEWPRIYVSLSRKEKEDDFLLMKGTKLPQRPKKRAKNVDKSLQFCFPGTFLSDLTKGRYEVREKKSVKKKPRGLKGIDRSMDSDSE